MHQVSDCSGGQAYSGRIVIRRLGMNAIVIISQWYSIGSLVFNPPHQAGKSRIRAQQLTQHLANSCIEFRERGDIANSGRMMMLRGSRP